MFLVGGEEVSFKQTKGGEYTDPNARIIMEGEPLGKKKIIGIKELAERAKKRDYIVIKFPPHLDKADPLNPHRRYKPGGRAIRFISTVIVDGKRQEWRYCDSVINDEEKKKTTYLLPSGKRHLQFTGFEKFGEDRLEMAWFLINISDQIGRDFIIEDLKKEAREKAAVRKQESDLLKFIYDEMSADDLPKIAKSWDIEGVDDMEQPMIQNALYDKVRMTKDGFDLFRENRFVNRFVELRSLIRDAIDAKVLMINPHIKDQEWWLVSYPDGTMPKYELKFCNQLSTHTRMDTLYNHFYDNPESEKLLIQAVENVG